jgi:hypothetical protein
MTGVARPVAPQGSQAPRWQAVARIIGDTLRSHTRPAQETRIAVSILNQMLDLGRSESVRAA